jgi:hypothetical protein
MAIKGKGRTRGGRTIAAPPRPVLVIRKPPVWRRPWVLSLVGILVLAAIAFVVSTTLRNSHARALVEKEKTAITAVSSAIAGDLPAGQTQAAGDTVLLYPTLSADLDKIKSGGVATATAVRTAKNFADQAQQTADRIDGIQILSIIHQDFDVGQTFKAKGLTQLTMVDAKNYMVQAFRLYHTAFVLWGQAAQATGDERDALVDQTKALAAQAQDLWNQGYGKLFGIEAFLGIAPPSQGLNPLTPGQLPPTGGQPSP